MQRKSAELPSVCTNERNSRFLASSCIWDTGLSLGLGESVLIGGTFTDATLIDEETGAVRIGKVLTTSVAPCRGFMETAKSQGQRAL